MSVLARATLVNRVVDELNWDSRINAAHIHVTDADGVIRLTGTVHSYAEQTAAQEAAHRVLGVRDIANDLMVVPVGARSDADIAHAVRHALEWHPFLPDERIQSTVSNGWVTLTGSVPYYFQREDAGDATGRIAGIRGVTNRISVDPDATTPVAAHEAIREALQRQAGREADRIDISFEDGELVVSGWARTWAEKRAILGAAGHVPGVRTIHDRIQIEAYA